MQLLFDTHALLWFLTDDRKLPRKIRSRLLEPGARLHFSSVSILEIAIKHSLKPDDMPCAPDEVREAAEASGLVEQPSEEQDAAVGGMEDVPPLLLVPLVKPRRGQGAASQGHGLAEHGLFPCSLAACVDDEPVFVLALEAPGQVHDAVGDDRGCRFRRANVARATDGGISGDNGLVYGVAAAHDIALMPAGFVFQSFFQG